jgi:hypothetical protein
MPTTSPSARGRLNRSRGLSFERDIARKLCRAGFFARRELEGFQGLGRDLLIGRPLRPGPVVDTKTCAYVVLPIALQLKVTLTASDLQRGLKEALAGPDAARYTLFVCLHRFPSKRKTRLLAVTRLPDKTLSPPETITWETLLSRLSSLPSILPIPWNAFSNEPPPSPPPPATSPLPRQSNSQMSFSPPELQRL